jgi:hypothetical protein
MSPLVNYESLTGMCKDVSEKKLSPGDMLISYDDNSKNGDVYIIMKIVKNNNGDRLFIIANGCENACDFYIPLFNNDRNYPWITLDDIKDQTEYKKNMGFYRLKGID